MNQAPVWLSDLCLLLLPFKNSSLFWMQSEIVHDLLEKPRASLPGLMKEPKSSANSPRLFSMCELPEDEEEDEVWWKLRSDRYAEELVTLMGGWERWARQRRREKAREKEAEGDQSCGCSGTLPQRLIELKHTCKSYSFAPFMSFDHPTLLQPLMHSSFILHGPIWLGGARDCDSSLEKG